MTLRDETVVSDREFNGVEVVRAARSLSVTNSGVGSGAYVTFQADQVIAFGNGFRVAEGDRITVASGRAEPGSLRIEPKK